MPVVNVCPVCGEKVDLNKDEYVRFQEQFQEKPLLLAHAKCMGTEAKGKATRRQGIFDAGGNS